MRKHQNECEDCTYLCDAFNVLLAPFPEHSLTNSVEQRGLKTPTFPLLVSVVPAFYRRRQFTVFTAARHVFLSWATVIQPMAPILFLEYSPTYSLTWQAVTFLQIALPQPSTIGTASLSTFLLTWSSTSHGAPHHTGHRISCQLVLLGPEDVLQHLFID